MKVEMKTTQTACPEGHTVVHYEKGQRVDLPESLARIFVKEGWARRIPERQTKNKGAAPENKSGKSRTRQRRKSHGT